MSALPSLTLKAGREKSLLRRHPWGFSGAVARVDGEPQSGDVVSVRSQSGEPLALAGYSPQSQIRFRVWTFAADERVDAAFVRRRLVDAIEARRRLGLLEPGGCCRLVFSESDGLPGLVVDRYGDWLVCQFLSAGIEPWRETIAATLAEALRPAGIYERSEASVRRKEGLPSRSGVLFGAAPPEELELVIDGMRQSFDLAHGQKTGGYLDQRVNRRQVACYAAGARVLDAYAYTGGFGIQCLLGGAVSASFVDSSAKALAAAAGQARLNGVEEQCAFVERQVPEHLRALAAAGERFDLIVLDPPKFVHSADQLKSGCRAYQDINRLAFGILAPGGTLATFSCSGLVDAALLQKVVASAAVEAGRDAQIIERLGQPADHPVGLHFPEAEYLKGLVLRASR